MNSFDALDEKATAKNVKSYFVRQFPQFVRYSSITNLKTLIRSPVMKDIPSTPNNINHTETETINRVSKVEYSYRMVNLTAMAINECDENSQTILFGNYFENKRDWQLQDTLGYGKTQYSLIKREALNQFADTFEAKSGIDLHKYLVQA
jgi:ArpU family phage transcriptional regulator